MLGNTIFISRVEHDIFHSFKINWIVLRAHLIFSISVLIKAWKIIFIVYSITVLKRELFCYKLSHSYAMGVTQQNITLVNIN